MLYNFSKIKQDNELKEFEINKEILNPPKYENLVNINEYINLYKKLISIYQAFSFLIINWMINNLQIFLTYYIHFILLVKKVKNQ